MKDFVGNELHVGDKIVYAYTSYNGMCMIKTEVAGFTEKMVKYLSYGNNIKLARPTNCVLYVQPEVENAQEG